MIRLSDFRPSDYQEQRRAKADTAWLDSLTALSLKACAKERSE